MRWLRLIWRTGRDAVARWSADDCGMASAAMSYYFACALFPLCLVLISMLGTALSLSSQAADARQQLLDLASRQASPWLAEQLTSVLDSAARNAPQGGRWGMFFLVVAAIGIFHQLDTFLDRLWRGAAPQASGVWNAIRRAATSRLTAFLMLLGLGALMVVMLVLDSALTVWQGKIEVAPFGKWIWSLGQLALSILLTGGLLSVLFRFLPPVPVAWRAAFAGGLCTACIWKLGQKVLAALLIGDHYSPYGVIGAFLAIMLWLYYSTAVLFLGAEVTWVVQNRMRTGRQPPDADAKQGTTNKQRKGD